MNLRDRKTYAGEKCKRTGGSWDSQSKALVRPRVSKTAYDSSAAFDKDKDWLGSRWTDKNSLGIKLDGLGTRVASDYDKVILPWGDPLAEAHDKATNTVACCDPPDWRPDFDPNAKIQVYYHDRFPSIPVRSIVEDAILMLEAKKDLKISIHSFIQEADGWRLVYKVLSNNYMAPDMKQGKIIECVFTKKAFDRMSSEIDKHAKLKARLDTNTFLKLRIAFLLYEAQKLGKRDAQLVNLDVFRIVSSSSHAIFDY